MQKELGILYVVATPIGNLQDITLRGIEVLKKVEWVAAEDTRRAATLLQHFSIQKPVISLHDFNERERTNKLIHHLQQGESIALISDAGTPLISDPGFYLVREVRSQDLPIVPIPGPCAAVTALSAAGLPSDRFIFEGFLPVKKEALQKRLTALKKEPRTQIFYEAPHRLMVSLEAMLAVYGPQRKAVVARELTKIYESFSYRTLGELIQQFKDHPDTLRGEIVILVEGAAEEAGASVEVLPEKVLAVLMEAMPLKQAALLASKITGERKNWLYDLGLKIQGATP